MSLINDALKRAGASSQSNTPNPTATIRLHAVEEERRPGMLLLLGVPLLVVALLLAGGWYWFMGRKAAVPPPVVAVQTKSPVSVAVKPVPAPAPPVTMPQTAKLDAATPPASIVNPSPANEEATPAPPKSLPPKKQPASTTSAASKSTGEFPLTLQGIYYRRTNPTALINKEVVGVGDSVMGIKVIAIERKSVTVEWDGKTKILPLQ